MGVGGNQSAVIHEKAGTGQIRCKENNDGRFYASNYLFRRQLQAFPETGVLPAEAGDVRWRAEEQDRNGTCRL